MAKPNVFIVDDDMDVRDSLSALLESAGFVVTPFESANAFLAGYKNETGCCLVTDIRMPGMDGLALQAELGRREIKLPIIIMTGHGDVPLAVRAMKAGAIDFLEKPFDDQRLIASVQKALEVGEITQADRARAAAAEESLGDLTDRERDVLLLLVAGHSNKVVAHKLNISPRTVEVHRGHIMDKTKARNLAGLVRIALAAGLKFPETG
ncbi:MAG: response regulator [Rhodospirillaceae bacterium]|nr:response regulator [Rhodospirillaceae bacterium]